MQWQRGRDSSYPSPISSNADLTLPDVEPARLLAAVCSAFEIRAASFSSDDWYVPAPARLREGAAQSLTAGEETPEAARAFQGLLEVGYLVASADGLADAERTALAELLERVTGRAVDKTTMEQHFADLDAACAMLGRRERLRRAAAEFENPTARKEAIGFAALVALTDGAIGAPELEALVTLGEHLELSEDDVLTAVGAAFHAVERELPGGAR